MKTLVLTNDSMFFRKTQDNESTQLHWNLPINFKNHNFQYVSIKKLTVFPMKPDKRYEPHSISMNIIDCGDGNPKQQIDFVLTDPIRRFFTMSDTGELLMTSFMTNYLEFFCFFFLKFMGISHMFSTIQDITACNRSTDY